LPTGSRSAWAKAAPTVVAPSEEGEYEEEAALEEELGAALESETFGASAGLASWPTSPQPAKKTSHRAVADTNAADETIIFSLLAPTSLLRGEGRGNIEASLRARLAFTAYAMRGARRSLRES
jgi:hypothetical protein